MRMNLKKVKPKRRFRKIVFYFLFIYFAFAISFYYSLVNRESSNNKKFINFLLNGGNSYLFEKKSFASTVNSGTKFLFNIDFSNPTSIITTNSLIKGESKVNYDDLEELKKVSSYMEDPNPGNLDNPVIYIYNSHQLENYNSANLDIYGITPNVLMASYLLKEKLNKSGIGTIVEDTNFTNFLTINGMDYADSYKASRIFILDKRNRYPTIRYFIDIHRDSVNKNSTTVTIGNKTYARILFVVGLEHSDYKNNLSNVEKINNLFNKYYPSLSRGIYKKEGKGVDGIYNQDIDSNVMLIEIGGVDNNINEVLNTTDAISDVLDKYINGDKNG